mgnify:CR=1 FL=1
MARTKNRGNNTANSPTSYKSMRWRLGKYIRLSKEDLLRGRDESNSVVNQRLLLEQYHQTHMDEFYEGDENDVYVDDGKTGTDTDREDFQRLLADIYSGKINCVIVKDLSRLSRNYTDAGNLIENLFVRLNIRFISLAEGVDSYRNPDSVSNIIVPITNVMNDQYCYQTSKKIRQVFDMKRRNGEFIGSYAPYGYIKDPEDKNHWIIDEEAANVVREIFHLCVSGYGPQQIAKEMMRRGYMNPTAYARANGRTPPDNRTLGDDYTWQNSTISHILTRMEYLGHTVNFKTYRKSYKNKKQLKNDPSQWRVFENTHEAIIDRETFDIVQRIRDGRRRVTPMGEMPILSGMVFCADCGKKLYQVRGRNLPQKEYMVCSTYRKIKGGCSSHQVRNEVLERLLLDGIQAVTAYAREHEADFVELITQKSQTELDKSLRDGKREMEQAQARIRKLDDIIQRLYEDNLEGKVSDERFARMTANYEDEQKGLESRVAELKKQLAAEKDRSVNVDHFLTLVRKYTDVQELTAEIVREFVEKVYVYQAERIDGQKVQRVRIVWNCIGEFTPPTVTNTEKSA